MVAKFCSRLSRSRWGTNLPNICPCHWSAKLVGVQCSWILAQEKARDVLWAEHMDRLVSVMLPREIG